MNGNGNGHRTISGRAWRGGTRYRASQSGRGNVVIRSRRAILGDEQEAVAGQVRRQFGEAVRVLWRTEGGAA